MIDVSELGHAAGRLIAFALTPKARPNREPEYAELIARFKADGTFRLLTEEILNGLKLILLNVGDMGLVLGCREEGLFALRASDYRQNMKVEERLIYGLIQLAIAAYVFPTAGSLSDSDSATLPVSTRKMVVYLRDRCQDLKKADEKDPETGSPELREAWRAVMARPQTRKRQEGPRTAGSLSGMVEFALERLAHGGLMRKTGDEEGGTWQALTAYRIQVRELAALESFQLIRNLGRNDSTSKGEK